MSLHLSNVCLFLAVLALFSAMVGAEFALLNSRRGVIEEGGKQFTSWVALRLLRQIENSVVAVQLFVVFLGVVIGWWGSEVILQYIQTIFDQFSFQIPAIVVYSVSLFFTFVIILYVLMVFGWLIPKSIAARHPERTLRAVAIPTYILTGLFMPLISLVTFSSEMILRIFGLTTEVEPTKVHSPEEIAELVTQSTESGELDKDEEEMLHGVIGLSDTIAREVMTPRTDLVTVPVTASLDEVLSIVVDTNFSRLPIIDGPVDNIVGILFEKDLLPYFAAENHPHARNPKDFDLKSIMREVFFVPDTKPINDLLAEFKQRKAHLAVVLDEHGGVDGVVTFEDLLEEIVGDIFDESDTAETSVQVDANGDLVVDGGVLVSDLNTDYGLSIPEGDFDTIAGFVFAALGRLPKEGEILEVFQGRVKLLNGENQNTSIEENFHEPSSVEEEIENAWSSTSKALVIVDKVDGYRVECVRLKILQTEEQPESQANLSASEEKI